MLDISKLLTEDRVIFDLKGNTKDEVITELIDLLCNDNVIKDKDIFKKVVLKREEEFSTGIGNYIAIPHGKSNVVVNAAIALGISKEGIDFNSLDEKPAHLIFLIAVPEESNDTHLQILGYISRKLMHEEVRNKLMNSNNYDDIINAFKN